MRIIKPQQLVLLKAAYQLGQHSTLGISVIAGCYLTRPTQFATEAKIWQAWNDAPHIMPIIDNAEPKPFAEFLLAGHVLRDPPVPTAHARVRVGRLERSWKIVGDRQNEESLPQPFSRMALDHSQTWQGPEGRLNPAGKPLANISLLTSSNAERLAAPSPVPHQFPARLQYIQQVQPFMNSEEYLEQVFPGLPENIDPRYFQMAAVEQWLDSPEWPADVTVELEGLHNDSSLRCTLPAVQAVVLAKYRERPPEMVNLQRKTLLLLPDSDLALIIFTGQLPLEEMLDESVETLMVGLDKAELPRDEHHYRGVFARRTAEKASQFEFLCDPDLMPPESTLEVIACAEHHPSFPNAAVGPQDPAIGAEFYHQVRLLIEGYGENPPKESVKPFDWGKWPANRDPATLIDEQDELDNKTFCDLKLVELRGKTFRYCRFITSNFSSATLQDCVFEHCRFEQTNWQGACLKNVTFEHATLQENDLRSIRWLQVTARYLIAEKCRCSGAVFNQCEWRNCQIAESDFSRSSWTENLWDNVALDDTHMDSAQLSRCTLEKCIFNQSVLKQSQLLRVKATATSVLGGNWQNVSFSECQISSLTVALGADLSSSHFCHSRLEKMGCKGAQMNGAVIEHCSVDVGNFDQATLTDARFLSSDIAGGRWKDALLTGSVWQASSLQQGQFYHADLRSASFLQCNLAGAAMARIKRDEETCFISCLLTGAIWLPRSHSQEGYMAKPEEHHE